MRPGPPAAVWTVLATGRKGPPAAVWTVLALGAIAASLDPPDAEMAKAYFRDAMALADDCGMRPLAARCHLGLGGLYRRTGDSAKAREHLGTTAAMLREMGVVLWLRQAEAELTALAEPFPDRIATNELIDRLREDDAH